MSIWWAIPGFVGLVGAFMLFGGLGRIFKARFVSGAFRFLFGGFVVAGAAMIGLVGLNLQTYARLTHEQLAAEVELKQTAPNQFDAIVRKANDKGELKEAQTFPVAGDKIRLEGRVWKLKPWANVIGEDSFYRFERIQGRWDDPSKENATPSTASDELADNAGVDVFALPLGKFSPFQLDTTFGSGVYMPMVDGAIYSVSMTQSAFIARGKNETAVNALNTWSNNTAPIASNAPAQPNPPATLQTTPPAQNVAPAPAPASPPPG